MKPDCLRGLICMPKFYYLTHPPRVAALKGAAYSGAGVCTRSFGRTGLGMTDPGLYEASRQIMFVTGFTVKESL